MIKKNELFGKLCGFLIILILILNAYLIVIIQLDQALNILFNSKLDPKQGSDSVLLRVSSNNVNVTKEGIYYILSNGILELKIRNDTAEQQLKSLREDSIFYEWSSGGHTIEIEHVDDSKSGIYYDSPASLRFTGINGSGYADLIIKYTSSYNVQGMNITLRYRMYENDPGMELNYSIETPNSLPSSKAIKRVTVFGRLNIQTPIVSSKKGYFVLPYRSSGILIPLATQDHTIGPNYGKYDAKYPQDWTMQFVGIVLGNEALLIYANDSYGFSKECIIQYSTSILPYFELSDYRIISESNVKYSLPYFWKFQLLPQKSNYVDIAKAYKNWSETTPFYDTIDEKISRQPELKNLTRTGIALHGQHWYNIMNPFSKFSSSIDGMKTLKKKYGLTHAIIHETEWRKDHSGERWDDYYPEYLPPSNLRGGESQYKKWANWLKQNGYILLTHTDSAIWDDRGTQYYQNDYRALDYSGNAERELYWSTSSWFMSQYAIRNVEKGITNEILNLGASGRFLDMLGRGVTLYGEDYNTYIPSVYRPYGKIWGTKQFLDQLNSTGAILGTEAFVEPLIPYIPYVSGRMWLPDDNQLNSFGFRHEGETRYVQVPLWSLVYHETSFISDHDLLYYSGIDTFNTTYPNTYYGKMTRLTDVENGAMMMIDILISTIDSQLAKEIIDYQKQYYHEIYNAELIDHYYINDGINIEDPRTWKVAVSVFKNPNNEYIISVCNYDSNSFTKTWKDNNSNRQIVVNSLPAYDWKTFLIDRPQDDLNINYTTFSTNINSGDYLSVNIIVDNMGTPVNNARIELIIGWETYTTYTDAQGHANFNLIPNFKGTFEVEIVAIKEGFDYGYTTFTLIVNAPIIPGFSSLLCLIILIDLISLVFVVKLITNFNFSPKFVRLNCIIYNIFNRKTRIN
ncbi:MAG: hypothetical protein ACTSPQ_06135 [Candidatus Helarchaeota archaeon]